MIYSLKIYCFQNKIPITEIILPKLIFCCNQNKLLYPYAQQEKGCGGWESKNLSSVGVDLRPTLSDRMG